MSRARRITGKNSADLSFVPSETARQAEAQNGNIKAEDMIPIVRKRAGPNGMFNP